jgi:hypothetical protein
MARIAEVVVCFEDVGRPPGGWSDQHRKHSRDDEPAWGAHCGFWILVLTVNHLGLCSLQRNALQDGGSSFA